MQVTFYSKECHTYGIQGTVQWISTPRFAKNECQHFRLSFASMNSFSFTILWYTCLRHQCWEYSSL